MFPTKTELEGGLVLSLDIWFSLLPPSCSHTCAFQRAFGSSFRFLCLRLGFGRGTVPFPSPLTPSQSPSPSQTPSFSPSVRASLSLSVSLPPSLCLSLSVSDSVAVSFACDVTGNVPDRRDEGKTTTKRWRCTCDQGGFRRRGMENCVSKRCERKENLHVAQVVVA